ncbi:MAG TPA: class I SAM-dependent methyltransferase [Isosphaeraceae bacterium]|jgi:ubiquinone/menaquinone biosynthesis C-methylase UbiE|nr:class I SAM-dependent methyltransferase [Isosphaeraceae bacterium]
MLERVLEPEAMDTPEEAHDYDAMDHSEVNARFVAEFLAIHGPARGGEVLDVGTGPGRIPIALCQADPLVSVLGVDLAEQMLAKARVNVAAAGLSARIRFERVDAKGLPYPTGSFEAVVSNTIIHHIPDPSPALGEMARLVSAGGTLFVRDLRRPADQADLDRLVALYAGQEAPEARALFSASLNAALRVEEVRDRIRALGLDPAGVTMSSDRHWTWAWRRPG